MDKFTTALRGYDKDEVNAFIDNIICKVEEMVKELEDKNKQISAYKANENTYKEVIEDMTCEIEKISKSQSNTKEIVVDDALERAKIDSKMLVDSANMQSRKIISDAEEQADIILKECLLESKKLEMQINILKKEIDKLEQKKETLY